VKRLILDRQIEAATHTEGTLTLGATKLSTIERPWIPTHPGGRPFESCVPAGRYRLVPFTRPSGERVVALVNPGLGVYLQEEDRPGDVGRYLILIHVGNWVQDVVGCIAPGLSLAPSAQGPMVRESRKAMSLLMQFIGEDEAELQISGTNRYEVSQ
jgi:hypothetical protein